MSVHLVLLGDSIFDNAAYVPGGPAVLDQVRRLAPAGWRATLTAVDGAVVESVYRQFDRIPADASHLALSVGGNDALGIAGGLLSIRTRTVEDSLAELAQVHMDFTQSYEALVKKLWQLGKPLILCTVYDAIPGLGAAERAGLCVFNDVITRVAFRLGAALVDLRILCAEPSDYSAVSPIEPSAQGGAKIAQALVQLIERSDCGSRVVSRLI